MPCRGRRPIPIFLSVLTLVCLGGGAVAPLCAAITSRGTEFWLAFPQGNGGSSSPASLFLTVTSDTDNSGQVQVPGLGFSAPFTVAAGASTQVAVPNTAEVKAADGIASLGIHVTAANQVSVYGLNNVQYASDGYLGLPVEALGTAYMVVSYKDGTYQGQQLVSSEFTVAATQDCTHLTVTPRITVGSHPAGTPYAVTLNQGDVYQLQDANPPDDLTGTQVASDKPVALFGAHQCDFVPAGVPSCNHLVEQLWPIPWWGTSFLTLPLATRGGGDTLRFLASSNATTVTVNGSPLSPLQQGWAVDANESVPLYITSNHPIYVIQFSDGGLQDNPGPDYNADPSMISIPPIAGFDTTYTVGVPVAPVTAFTGHYENILLSGSGTVTFDGAPLPSAYFTAISGAYKGAQISVSAEVHHLSSNIPFGVIAYGYGNADAYGYPGGIFLSSNTPPPTSTPGGACTSPTPTATATPTLTPTWTPTSTATSTPTPSPTFTPTATPTPTATNTPTPSATATSTGTPSWTPTPIVSTSDSPTSTFTPTLTFTPTPTPTESPTFTPSLSPTPTSSWTPTPTLTPTWTPTPIWTPTPSPTGTPSPTDSPTPTVPLPTPTFISTPACEIRVWPNPFQPARAVNGVLKISCLPDGATVAFYTVSGEWVRQLESAGALTTWDGRNQNGAPVSSGVYFYVIQKGGEVLRVGKLIVQNGG